MHTASLDNSTKKAQWLKTFTYLPCPLRPQIGMAEAVQSLFLYKECYLSVLRFPLSTTCICNFSLPPVEYGRVCHQNGSTYTTFKYFSNYTPFECFSNYTLFKCFNYNPNHPQRPLWIPFRQIRRRQVKFPTSKWASHNRNRRVGRWLEIEPVGKGNFGIGDLYLAPSSKHNPLDEIRSNELL